MIYRDIFEYRDISKIWYFFWRYDTIRYIDIENDIWIFLIYRIITNGEWQNLTPLLRTKTPQPINTKFETADYVHETILCAKFCANPSIGGFSANGWNITKIFLIYIYLFCWRTYRTYRRTDFWRRSKVGYHDLSNMTYLTRLIMNLYIQFWCFKSEQCNYFKIYWLYKPSVFYLKIVTQH